MLIYAFVFCIFSVIFSVRIVTMIARSCWHSGGWGCLNMVTVRVATGKPRQKTLLLLTKNKNKNIFQREKYSKFAP